MSSTTRALNGRDAMPDGGVLEIETRNVVLDEGAVAGCSPGSYVKVSVTDDGCGMPPEVRDRVFEPFFTTKEVGKGTGLGLSMVYGFVRQSGGHIAIESAPGAGTTVALYLPKATQKPDAGLEAIQPQAIPEGSERILVVEDNEDILEVTSAMLTTFGYWVLCARNGAEAIQMLQSGQEFELLFSDVVMPNGMNGVELAREARRLRKGIKIPAHLWLRGGCVGTTSSGRRVPDHRQTLPPGRLGAASAVNPARSVRSSLPAFASLCLPRLR